MASLSELSTFLSIDARLDVICTALEYILGFTGSKEGRELVRSNEDIVKKLFDLLTHKNEVISRDSHLIIVNLSADEDVHTVNYWVKVIPNILHYLRIPQWVHADKLCTILSNLSRSIKGAEILYKILTQSKGDEQSSSVPSLYQLVDIFDRWESYNPNANFHYLASIFVNLSQISPARSLFLDHSECLLPRLLPYTHFADSCIRRGGIVGLVKNLCFEVDHHQWLLSEDIDVLSSLLLPLAGPEQYEEEETEKLPLDLQYLPDDKQREPDPDIRKMLLEALMKLCCTKFGRKFLREKQTYLILRELHKWEEEVEVKNVCENLVHILIADEPESGMENLHEVELRDQATLAVTK